MKGMIRVFSMIGLITLHVAGITVLSSGQLAPVVLITAAIVWTTLLGFPAVLWPLLTTLIISDSLLFGGVQLPSIYLVLVAYAVSFFMKRTLVGEANGLSFLLLALSAGVAAPGYLVFAWLVDRVVPFSASSVSVVTPFLWDASFWVIGLNMVCGVACYLILTPVLVWCERMIRVLSQDAAFSIK